MRHLTYKRRHLHYLRLRPRQRRLNDHSHPPHRIDANYCYFSVIIFIWRYRE